MTCLCHHIPSNIILLYLFLLPILISSYSLHEILHDTQTIPWETFVPYRGEILQDIWIHQSTTPHRNIETCHRLFEKALKPVDIEWPPPKAPPDNTELAFTMGGKSQLQHLWTEQRQNGGQGYEWNIELFQEIIAKEQIGCGFYEEDHCDKILLKHQDLIRNKTAIVVGSQSPWAEASLFKFGAEHVTTIEYMKIKSNYPNYSTFLPSEVAHRYLHRLWKLVDFAYSYSSLEHDGLGRYGDPINPYGDIESLARIRCLLKPGGILFLAIPVAPDTIVWNLHRIYGRYRLGLMLLGWNILHIYPETCNVDDPSLHGNYMCQPLLILQKPFPSNHSNVT